MPELLDVRQFKKYFVEHGFNQTVQQVTVTEPAMLKQTSESDLNQKLKNHQFTKARRHGKHLLVKIGDWWVVFHFGMSGALKYQPNTETPPKYSRVAFRFKKHTLHYTSVRKLGKVSLTSKPTKHIQEQDLGPDAAEVTEQKFYKLLSDKRGMLKTALMDQSMLAGLGNIMSDELCFQTKLHPKISVNKIDKKTCSQLYKNMKKIIKGSYGDREMPFSRHRKPGERCPRCGKDKIKRIKVGGRSSYLCPRCQKK